MTDLRKAAQQALEALQISQDYVEASANAKLAAGWGEQLDRAEKAITALREALEQQAEPCQFCGLIKCDPRCMWVQKDIGVEQAESVAPKCGAIIEVFDKDWRMEYLSLPVGKHKLYTQQYTYTAPSQQQAEPVAEKFEAMHANGNVWITTIAAAAVVRNTPPSQRQ